MCASFPFYFEGGVLDLIALVPHDCLSFYDQADYQYTTRPRAYNTFFMFNSTEHEIFPAHKC